MIVQYQVIFIGCHYDYVVYKIDSDYIRIPKINIYIKITHFVLMHFLHFTSIAQKSEYLSN